jgi:hypothetical protein
MQKKIVGLVIALIAVFALSGCGDTEVYVEEPAPEEVALFLVDINGIGIEYVPYICYAPDGSIVADFETDFYGEFSFVPGDRCEFDLFGFPSDIVEPLFIVDDLGYGKDDIPYSCINGLSVLEGTTDMDGYFAYPVDAFCKFYL